MAQKGAINQPIVDSRKSILILAPLSKSGGRELETGFIAQTVSKSHLVRVISIGMHLRHSQVLEFDGFSSSSLLAQILKKFKWVNFLANLLAFFSKNRVPEEQLRRPLFKKSLDVERKKHQILKQEIDQADLVFICAQVYSNYLELIVKYASDKGIPILFRTTGTIHDDERLTKLSWLSRVDHFIHHSSNNAKGLLRCFEHSYSVIDQCAYNEEELLKLPIKKGPVRSFFVCARLTSEKQIDTVIQAFINQAQSDWELHIYGEGVLLDYLQDTAANHSQVYFHGYVNYNLVSTIFAKHDCLVISSKEEAGPLTGIEAMAAGNWLVSTRVGAMPERFGERPIWYDGSQKSLEGKMREITDDQSIKNNDYRAVMRNEYIAKYSLEAVKQMYANCIEDLLASTDKKIKK